MPAADYRYDLPEGLIAQEPAEPRDSSRLMAYDSGTDELTLTRFSHIAAHIPEGSVIVLNDTKVVPARLELKRKTGGTVKILFLMNEWERGSAIKGLPDRGVPPGEILYIDGKPMIETVSNKDEEFVFRLSIEPSQFEALCLAAGRTPLPPYIRSGLSESDLRHRYQTTFASKPASVAAPTASLHFTDRVFRSLEAKGIEIAYVTLHVGRGTFSPVTDSQEVEGKLHPEPMHISGASAAVISRAKREGRRVIAAGTTVTRLLESAAGHILEGRGYDGETRLFIRPLYDFRVVDGLLTNFHLPGTSLIALVDAFLRSKGAAKDWRALYGMAMKEKMRFYSFGDAMLLT